MTGNAPSFARLLLRIFLPFAFAYFLSYIFRGVNAVIFPYLERDVGITAGDLGLLTSSFFLFFAGCMPVLGVRSTATTAQGSDRAAGDRRPGSALFGAGKLAARALSLARGLIGLGFAGGLMAAIKISPVVSAAPLGVDHGFHMMAGGAGSMAATLPSSGRCRW